MCGTNWRPVGDLVGELVEDGFGKHWQQHHLLTQGQALHQAIRILEPQRIHSVCRDYDHRLVRQEIHNEPQCQDTLCVREQPNMLYIYIYIYMYWL